MIKHHLRDGTVLDDITGHVVKKEDVPIAYAIMDQMNNQKQKRKQRGEKSL